MTPDAAPVARRADRRRLQDRMRELAELDELMRQAGGLPSVPEPLPLHRTGRADGAGETAR